MFVLNNVDILAKYEQVKLLKVTDTGGQPNNKFIWLHGTELVENLSFDNGEIEIELLIEDKEILVSRLINEIKSGELITNIDFSNIVTLTGYEKEFLSENLFKLTLKYSASFKMSLEKEINVSEFTSIINDGDLDTSIELIIRPLQVNCGVSINGNGINVTGVNTGDIVEITRDGKVLINGVNGFSKIDFTEFPKLLTGENMIDIYNCTATIKFRSLYI